jgi:DNA-binding CsgD family transcriptional regulator
VLRPDIIAAATEDVLSAALLGDGWEEALSHLAIAAGARGVTIIRNRNRRLVAALANSEIAEPVATYLAGRAPPNSRQVRVAHHFDDGFRIDHDDYTMDETAKDIYYQEYLRPVGLFWHANARLNFHGNEELAISFKRDLKRGPFGHDDAATLNAILPHVRVAARVAHRVLDAEVSGMARRLHERGDPVFEIDFWGRVLRTHGFEDSDDQQVGILGHRLTANDERDQVKVDRAIMTAVKAPQHPATAALGGHQGERCLLQVIPVKGRTRDVFLSASAVAVLLKRPSRLKLDVPRSVVRELFCLTDRELDVAMLLVGGHSLEEIAKSHHTQVNTVRYHLKSIFEKTGAHRQAELIVLLANLKA